jgi:receptor expression-enhancing protein 5/6
MDNTVWITLLSSLAVLVAVAIAYHGLARTRGREPWPHAIFVGIAVLLILLVPTSIAKYVFSALSVTVIATVFPIYESVRAVCTPEEDDDKKWLQYWMVGGVIFVLTEWVDNVIKSDRVVYWYESMFFFFLWLFFPKTDGAALIYDFVTEPFLAPHIRPLAYKMTNWLTALYQTMMNALHLWVIWIIFMFLPAGLKRIIAVAIGTVYPFVSSVAAASTEEVEDDTYWLTYWSCYGCLFLLMEILETWLGWIPGFYTLIILATVYLFLPMFQGADKVFRKILVPLAGLHEMLMLRDAIQVKKRMLKDLDPERARVVRKAIAKFYGDEGDAADPAELKKELLTSWQGIKMPSIRNPFASGGGQEEEKHPDETTPMV